MQRATDLSVIKVVEPMLNKTWKWGWKLLLVYVLSLSLCACSSEKENTSTEVEPSNFEKGTILIKYKPEIEKAEIEEFRRKHGFALKESMDSINVELVILPKEMAVEEALGICRNNPQIIEYAEPNYYRYLQGGANEN